MIINDEKGPDKAQRNPQDLTDKNELFETMRPAKALAVMALPTVASQMIILIYNLAAMGIVLKVERIPLNIGLGVLLGMVPLVAYH